MMGQQQRREMVKERGKRRAGGMVVEKDMREDVRTQQNKNYMLFKQV